MNSSWTDRIKQMEVPPPEEGWDKIAASLDESFIGHEFPSTLHHAEINPPADTWNKIEESLHVETTPVIPVQPIGNRVPFIRYAVAACLIGLISFAAIRFLSMRNTKGEVVSIPVSAPINDRASDSNSSSLPPQTDTGKEAGTPEETKHDYARLDQTSRAITSKAGNRLYNSPAQLFSSLSGEMMLEKNPEIQYSHRAAVNDSPEDKDVTRYLMFKDSEGRFIKISKKLTSLFCCVSGEEQDENCNDQLKKWREKIASSSFIPSPDNFMDILDLVSSLQDTRN